MKFPYEITEKMIEIPKYEIKMTKYTKMVCLKMNYGSKKNSVYFVILLIHLC